MTDAVKILVAIALISVFFVAVGLTFSSGLAGIAMHDLWEAGTYEAGPDPHMHEPDALFSSWFMGVNVIVMIATMVAGRYVLAGTARLIFRVLSV